jgi:SAM-dependent methyltransferase
MSRLVRVDRGDLLVAPDLPSLAAEPGPIRLALLDPLDPFRPSDLLSVGSDSDNAQRADDVLLCCRQGALGLHRRRDLAAVVPAGVVGRVLAVARGPVVLPLTTGLLRRCPTRWLSVVLDGIELMARLRRPLTPPLCLGPPAACLTGVRSKYDAPVEVGAYRAEAGAGLDPLEQAVISRYLKPRARLLDVGCGAGREAIALARAGHRIVAIDIAPRMIAAAQQVADREGLTVGWRVQSVTDVDDPPGSFDAVYLAGAYHHIPGRALRIETLRRLGRTLTADGVLILMVHYRARRIISRSALVDWLRRVGRGAGVARLSEPGDRQIRAVSAVSDPGVACFFHDFSGPDDVKAEIVAAGLSGQEELPGWWICRTRT